MMMTHPGAVGADFLHRLEEYAARFAADFPQSKPARWAEVYLQGLLAGEGRKSIEALARQVVLPPSLHDKDPDQALHHFINHSPWDEQRLCRRYRALMAALFASHRGCFVLDDICFPKQGRHTVGVQRQSASSLARKINCQVAVAAHYVSPSGHFPLGLRLYLPGSWLADPRRLDQAGVPEGERRPLARSDIALELLDRVREEEVPGWLVIAGPGYGTAASFRDGVTARGLKYIAEVTDDFVVFPEAPTWVRPPALGPGPPGPRLAPDSPLPVPVQELARAALSAPRRAGAGPRRSSPAHFLWRRVWPGQGWATGDCADADPVWLLAEVLGDGRFRCALSNLAVSTSLRMAVRLWRNRDVFEQDHKLMNDRLGLSHFEGRSWRGFHHHACMVMLAYGFLACQAARFGPAETAPGPQEFGPLVE